MSKPKILEMQGTLLWKNENPTSNIAVGTTIVLKNDDYDLLKIIYRRHSAQAVVYACECLKGFNADLTCMSTQLGNGWIRSRTLKYLTDTTLEIGPGYLQYVNADIGEDAGACIPLYIIGYKIGLSE